MSEVKRRQLQEAVALSPTETDMQPGTARFASLLEAHRGERHIIVIQNFPDPDAISSALAHKMISAEYNIDADIVYDGIISHQENLALVRLLDIDLMRYNSDYDLSRYAASIFVNNQGSRTVLTERLKQAGVKPLMIVDHHELQTSLGVELLDIQKVGATGTIYTGYLRDGLLVLDKTNSKHVQLATALMHGIRTETGNLVRARAEDFLACAYLVRFADQALLSEILKVKRSKKVMDIIETALGNRAVRDNYSISGVGYLRSDDRDAIPQAADFLLTEENVHTAIVYGIMIMDSGREVVIGSLRTSKLTLNTDEFLKDAFGKNEQGSYYGGGRLDAGGFEIPISFLSGYADEEFMKLKWKIYDAQVKQKIWSKIGVEDRQRTTTRSEES